MTFQELPSQCSINGCSLVLLLLLYSPTAQMLVAESAVTAFREPIPASLGLLTIDQEEPSQCSINACPEP
jgi:hypothetical protein